MIKILNNYNIQYNDLSGTISNVWLDAHEYDISRTILSPYSFIKMEFKVNYISSPIINQTLSFRIIKTYNNSDVSYIVFEDIDCMSDIVFTRDKTPSTPIEDETKKEPSQSQLISTVIKACKDDDYEPLKSLKTEEDKLTLSFVLNVIDGIRETPGRILIITSNHYNKLDNALVRPGRIDIDLEIKKANRKVIKEIYKFLFNNNIDNIDLEKIPEYKYSCAEIFNIFLKSHDKEAFINELISE